MVIKPNTSRKTMLRQHAGTIPIGDIPQVAAVIRKAHKKHGGWNGSTKGQILLTIHSSGAVINKGPIAPAKATLEQVGSVEVCDHIVCGRGEGRLGPRAADKRQRGEKGFQEVAG